MQTDHQDKITHKNWLNAQEKAQLIALIAACFKGVDSVAYFQRYFANPAHQRCALRLFYQDGQLTGYCLLTFTQSGKATVMGASAAFLPGFRGQNSTFAFSLRWALRTWLRQPLRPLYYLDTMLSPAMYRAIGKKVALIYPNPAMNAAETARYRALVGNAEPSPWRGLGCLKTVGRSSNYSAADLQQLKQSQKAEIAFYCQLNPHFEQGIALLVLIPVSFKQLICTLWKGLRQS
ncbi:hypothetical protein [Rheinheimera sp.]|uniref:hypothetical protein n=1 Tax=Rheinheimera sp. TaxID=1869214 RepID=UPI00307E80EF